MFLGFREKKRKATKYPEYLPKIEKELRNRSKFQIISTKDGSTTDQCCLVLHILHRPFIDFIGVGLLLEMETLFPTRNETSRATCSAQ
jgi:hypothetical protein